MKRFLSLWVVFVLLQGCVPHSTRLPVTERTNQELIRELKKYEYSSNEDPDYSLQEVFDELSKRGASASEAAPMLARMIAFDGATSVTASKPLVAMGPSTKSSIPYLMINLNNSREDVRRYSIFVLGIIGSDASCAVPSLCVYNSKTTPPNNLECRAEEKMRCPRIQMVV
jgi:hypothetical protein